MKNLVRRRLYLVVIALLLVLLTTVVHAASVDLDTFDLNMHFVSIGFGGGPTSACDQFNGGTDMVGGERELLIERTGGTSSVTADVGFSSPGGLSLNVGTGTQGRVTIQLDGSDVDCALTYGLNINLDPNDGISVFVQEVDLNARITMRIYRSLGNYSSYTYILPYPIDPPGTEIYFPFDQFTPTGLGADYTSVAAIEVVLDGTFVSGLDMAIDYISSDFSRDYGDLPAAYNNTHNNPGDPDNGARHSIGAIYMGPSIDSEVDGQESATATGDAARSDDEDGVIRSGANWGGGTGGISVDITKPVGVNGCLVGWIDWDQSNVFQSPPTVGAVSELVVNAVVPADTNIGFTTPTLADYGGAYPATLNARFRMFQANDPLFATYGLTPLDAFGCPTASSAADVTQLVFGAASDGEVEDYQWEFVPTAITLSNATASSSDSGLVMVFVVAAAGLAVLTFFMRRRRIDDMPSKG